MKDNFFHPLHTHTGRNIRHIFPCMWREGEVDYFTHTHGVRNYNGVHYLPRGGWGRRRHLGLLGNIKIAYANRLSLYKFLRVLRAMLFLYTRWLEHASSPRPPILFSLMEVSIFIAKRDTTGNFCDRFVDHSKQRQLATKK